MYYNIVVNIHWLRISSAFHSYLPCVDWQNSFRETAICLKTKLLKCGIGNENDNCYTQGIWKIKIEDIFYILEQLICNFIVWVHYDSHLYLTTFIQVSKAPHSRKKRHVISCLLGSSQSRDVLQNEVSDNARWNFW